WRNQAEVRVPHRAAEPIKPFSRCPRLMGNRRAEGQSSYVLKATRLKCEGIAAIFQPKFRPNLRIFGLRFEFSWRSAANASCTKVSDLPQLENVLSRLTRQIPDGLESVISTCAAHAATRVAVTDGSRTPRASAAEESRKCRRCARSSRGDPAVPLG